MWARDISHRLAGVGQKRASWRRANRDLDERQVTLMGVTAVIVFDVPMLNFTVASSTWRHLWGGTLLALLLGPWEGSLVLAAVLAVLAVIFQDGGLLALRANVLTASRHDSSPALMG
jgi:cobalt/nickel transport system permease protein